LFFIFLSFRLYVEWWHEPRAKRQFNDVPVCGVFGTREDKVNDAGVLLELGKGIIFGAATSAIHHSELHLPAVLALAWGKVPSPSLAQVRRAPNIQNGQVAKVRLDLELK